MSYRIFKLKNSPYWYVDFGTHQARRLRCSTGTADKAQAIAFAKHRQAELWRQEKLGERPSVTWDYAVIEWLKAHEHKKSIEDDKQRLRVLSEHLRGFVVTAITASILRGDIERLPGISSSTRNRYLAAGRAILNYAHRREWRDYDIRIEPFPEARHRIRWITPAEAQRLIAELPDYLRAMAEFSLATGLRESNVRLLEWSCVDLSRAIAWVHGDMAKGGKDLTVPLNAGAMAVLQAQRGKHWKWVFPLKGRAGRGLGPIAACTGKAWRLALARAKIENFRWHDLRHTWASWHVQNGTSLYDLKNLGGWASMVMVERYAHMSHERVAKVAGNIDGVWLTSGKLNLPSIPDKRRRPAPVAASRLVDDALHGGLKRLEPNSAAENTSSTIIDLRESVHARHVPESAETDESMPRTVTKLAKIRQTK